MYFMEILQSVLIHANDYELAKLKSQTVEDFAFDYKLDTVKLSFDLAQMGITKRYKLNELVKNFEKVAK